MIGFDEQNKLFDLIGRECKRDVDALVIGGSAMLFYNFPKARTKDIDIVLFSEDDRNYLVGVLKKMGFALEKPGKEGHVPLRLILDEYILDVFSDFVFRLKVSEGMVSRVKEKVEFGRFRVSVISPEDIIFS